MCGKLNPNSGSGSKGPSFARGFEKLVQVGPGMVDDGRPFANSYPSKTAGKKPLESLAGGCERRFDVCVV